MLNRYRSFWGWLVGIIALAGCQNPESVPTLDARAQPWMDLADSLYASHPKKALHYAMRADSLALLQGHDSLHCAALRRIAQVYTTLGKFEESVHQYDAFLTSCGASYAHLSLTAHINRAVLYTNLGNYPQAERCLHEADSLARSGSYVEERMAVHQCRARLYYYTDNYPGMYREALAAKQLSTQHQQPARLAAALTTLGLYHLETGQTDSALWYQQQAMNTSLQNGDSVTAMHTQINLADLYRRQQAWDSAGYYLGKGKRLAQLLHDEPTRVTVLINEAYALYDRGHFQEAFDTLDVATSLHDSLVNLEQARHLEELEVQYQTREKQNQIHALQAEQEINRWQLGVWIAAFVLVLIAGTAVGINLTQRRRHEKKEATHRIEKLEQEKSVLALESMLYAQEEERQRIAKDLHDGIGALLSTARLQINKVEQELDKLQDLDLVKSTEAIIARASTEVRRVSHNMMPGVLMELGLVEAIEDFIAKQPKGMAIDFVHDLGETRLPDEIEIMLYRIVQECVNNSHKHSEATQVDLSLLVEQEVLTLEYRDNGRGFNRNEWDNLSNLGLNSIRSRAHYLKGRVTLDTAPGQGVSYTLIIPLFHEKA